MATSVIDCSVTSNSNNSSTTTGLIFHKSMFRTDEKVGLNEKPAPDDLARRQAGARRTAWIIAAIAIAFFVASLLHGHFVGIPNWVPTR
jgi:hypothetical protein